MTAEREDIHDVFVIGGGINGVGIARDAAGRGLSVCLAEMGDLASATSSSSTKLFHGGLRYLEFFEFRLVREALIEREVLLRAMPHISWPMRFVIPLDPDMRFDLETPVSRLLAHVAPWMKGRRPGWLIRLGLALYDTMGGRKILPGTTRLDLTKAPEGRPLNDRCSVAFEYSDCWVDDARLVVLSARDAQARGATILTRTRVVSANADNGVWRIMLEADGQRRNVLAKALVNATGPWAGDASNGTIHAKDMGGVRLVRGSHIVTRRLFDHDKSYFFQGGDGRIMFAIPYEDEFTLIGTTEVAHDAPDRSPVCTAAERDYMIDFVNGYLKTPISATDVVWSYSGVRPLYDEDGGSATAASRDYTLKLDDTSGAPVLHVLGGKITTFRRLAEASMEKLAPFFDAAPEPWTAGVPLPGGDFPVDGAATLKQELLSRYPFLTVDWAHRLVRSYGSDAFDLLGTASQKQDLGRDFGASLTEREVEWLMDKEWARTAEDVLWRRSKLGLRLTTQDALELDDWMAGRLSDRALAAE